jgi:hypothetical protein
MLSTPHVHCHGIFMLSIGFILPCLFCGIILIGVEAESGLCPGTQLPLEPARFEDASRARNGHRPAAPPPSISRGAYPPGAD